MPTDFLQSGGGGADWRELTHWRGLSGTQELWVYLAYACVMTVSV